MSTLSIKRISASSQPALGIRDSPEFAKLVDISRCIGCKGCEVACKEWNELKVEPTVNFGSFQSHEDLSADTWLLMRFKEVDINGNLAWLIKKDACLHCEEPPCLEACPAPGAIVQYMNGIVDFDQDKCIGCKYCISACPFDIPRFSDDTHTVHKCNMCIDRVESGLEPACVKTCPTQAILWGSKEDMLTLAEQKVERLERRGFEHAALYNPAGVGGTHMMYVLPHGDRLADYDLPANPTAAPSPLAGLLFLRRMGAWLFGFSLIGTVLHYLRFGPKAVPTVPEALSTEPEVVPTATAADPDREPAESE